MGPITILPIYWSVQKPIAQIFDPDGGPKVLIA